MKNTEKLVELLKREGLIANIAIRVGKYGDVLGEVYSDGVDSRTLFDIASVTKIIVTTTLALIAIDECKLNITDKISKYFTVPEWYKELTVFNLLTHTMGIGHRNLTDKNNTYDNIAEYILSLKGNEVGKDVEYSCPAFILLGKILEKICGKKLNALFDEKIALPLGLKNSGFCPNKSLYGNMVNSNVEDEKIGIVNDYNCQYLGGIAGNAGLFSNIEDVTSYVNMLLNNGENLLSRSVLETAAKNYTADMSESRGLGFLYVDERYKQTGDLFPNGSIGHCGHTGQSVFLNRESGLYVIILSDATISTVKKYGKEKYDKVIQMREDLHNAIKKDLGI